MARHNPYHFVPIRGADRPADIPRTDVGAAQCAPQVTHDRYVSDTVSGRLICRLVTERPVVLGAARRPRDGAAAAVEPFLLSGKPAIPATSLKGLVASTFEAATNSALRVLDNAFYSFRKTMNDNDLFCSAVGMVVEECGKLRLRPLTLPLTQAALRTPYQGMFPEPNLKVYIGTRTTIKDPTTFTYRTFRDDRPKYYGMRLDPPTWSNPDVLDMTQVVYHKSGWVLAQKPRDHASPIPWDDIERMPATQRSQYTRGIVRVLGAWGRDEVISTGKKHELFIPYTTAMAAWPTYEIPADVIDRFHELADHRTDDRGELPFEPKDTRRNTDPARLGDKFRLKPGDLVYFRAVGNNVIKEISLSSIWRGRVETTIGNNSKAARAHDFFRAVSKELLPFNPERERVSLAEQVFGFVEHLSEDRDPNAPAGLALKGRVRFSPACLQSVGGEDYSDWSFGDPDPSPFDGPVTLRILATPKPPSPALYFKGQNGKGRYFRKRDLRPGNQHPQGRKVYLHHRGNERGCWETRDPGDSFEQKVCVTPLKENAEFWFHVDFDNLTQQEVQLLCYALRPTPEFRHKLGMGKPLGFGTVRIDPVALLHVDRRRRYTEGGLFEPRFQEAYFSNNEDSDGWPARYQRNAEPVEAPDGGHAEVHGPMGKAQQARATLEAEIRSALEMLGDPSQLRARVGPPVVQHQNGESETFRWFVANDLGSKNDDAGVECAATKEYLKPLAEDEPLPLLNDLPWAG